MRTRHLLLALAFSLATSLPILADDFSGDQPMQYSPHWLPSGHASASDGSTAGAAAGSQTDSPDWRVRSAAFEESPAKPSAGGDSATAHAADSPKAKPAVEPRAGGGQTRRRDSRFANLSASRKTRRKWPATSPVAAWTGASAMGRARRRANDLVASSPVPRRRTGSKSMR